MEKHYDISYSYPTHKVLEFQAGPDRAFWRNKNYLHVWTLSVAPYVYGINEVRPWNLINKMRRTLYCTFTYAFIKENHAIERTDFLPFLSIYKRCSQLSSSQLRIGLNVLFNDSAECHIIHTFVRNRDFEMIRLCTSVCLKVRGYHQVAPT